VKIITTGTNAIPYEIPVRLKIGTGFKTNFYVIGIRLGAPKVYVHLQVL
jgi:hypothetical protein